jgi:predicted nucleic acid-binding protein
MNQPVFIDSAAWIALLHSADSLHNQTVGTYDKLVADRRDFVTTSLVLVEVASALSAQTRRHLAIELEQRLRSSAICEIIWIDRELYEHSWRLYRERSDKNWSLVDCFSFVVMRNKHIDEALTADHHFEQAGFAKLL